MTKQRASRGKEDLPAVTKRPAWRWFVSALLLLHLSAVFAPPFAMISSSMEAVSPPAALAMDALRPYVDLAFLNHGYEFFAPNPGASHLIHYRLEFEDGRPPVEKTLPDLDRHWPRLLYHRHFMLTEQLHADFVMPQPPETDNEEALQAWRARRAVYQAKWHSYEEHLRTKYGASKVTMTRVEHAQPSWGDFQFGSLQLDADELYTNLSEGPAALPEPESEEIVMPKAQP